MIVVDASLAVKWLVYEPLSDLARSFREQNLRQLAGPDLLVLEVASAIVRRANVGLVAREDVSEILETWTAGHQSRMSVVRTTALRLRSATDIAVSISHPLKDCLYLALAVELDCDLATCDAKFQAKAAPVHQRVRLLEEFAPDRTG